MPLETSSILIIIIKTKPFAICMSLVSRVEAIIARHSGVKSTAGLYSGHCPLSLFTNRLRFLGPTTSSKMGGIPGLGDRAAMEKERLARLAARSSGTKRARSITPPALSRPSKAAKLDDGGKSDISGAVEGPEVPKEISRGLPAPLSKQNQPLSQSSSQPLSLPSSQSSSQPSSQTTVPPPSSTLKYPNGVIKRTWAFGHTRTEDDIKIEEVLEKNTLRTGVLSAFQWDTNWIMSKINMAQSKLIFVMQAKEQSLRDQILSETEYLRKSLRICFPSMEGQINCMHSKLMLLFHPHKLRVAVPSANLMKYDWGETGIMENSIFLIDLPRLPEDQATQQELIPFGEELVYFLEKQGLDETVRRSLYKFDFSATAHLAFVHSTGGANYSEEMQRTGYMGLNRAVTDLGLTSDTDLQIDFAASSIGSLNDAQLRCIYTAARGVTDMDPAPKTRKAQPASTLPSVRDQFRIYFPTLETVAASTGGVDNGGTICMQRKWWEGVNAFPRDCFRDHQSMRKGLLSHNKILYARGHRNGEDVAWAYMGSANLSESAWGKVVWDAKQKAWKINCRNWECGVLIRVPNETLKAAKHDEELAKAGKDVVSLDVFKGVVEVPFQYPGRVYGDREPWYFMEPHEGTHS